MTKYIIRRCIQAIPVLIGITIVVYIILQLAPGGPQAKFAQNPRMTPAEGRVHEGTGPRPADPDPVLPPWMGFCDPTARASTSSGRRAGRTSCRRASAVPRTGSSTVTSATRSPPARRSATRSSGRLPPFILAGVALIIWIGRHVIGVLRDQTVLVVRQRLDGDLSSA